MSYSNGAGQRILTPLIKKGMDGDDGPVYDLSSGWVEFSGASSGTLGRFVVSGSNNEEVTWTRNTGVDDGAISAYITCNVGIIPNGQSIGMRVEFTSVIDTGDSEYTMTDNGYLLVGGPSISRFDKPAAGRIMWAVETNGDPSTSVSLRIGMGCVTPEANTKSFTLKNVQIFLVETVTGDVSTQLIDEFSFLANGLNVNDRDNIISIETASNYNPTLIDGGSGSQKGHFTVEVPSIDSGAGESHKGIAIMGDSWFIGADTISQPFIRDFPDYAFRVNANGGKRIEAMVSQVASLINVAAGQKPFAVFLGTAINDIDGSASTGAETFGYVESIRDICVANGVYLIVMYHPPVSRSAGWISNPAIQVQIDAYNALLTALTIANDNMVAIDTYTLLQGDAGSGDSLTRLSNTSFGDSVTYDDSTGNHILENGNALIRPLTIAAFDLLPATRAVEGRPALTTPYSNIFNSNGDVVNVDLGVNWTGEVGLFENGLPPGLAMNTNTGIVTGTITQNGDFQPVITATNSFVPNISVAPTGSFHWYVGAQARMFTKLDSIGSNATWFSFKETDLTLAELDDAFFSNQYAASVLSTGDVLTITASDGQKIVNVTVVKQSRTVTLSSGLTIA